MAIREVTGDNVGHLRRIGREHLAVRTGFDDEAGVAAWAAAKYRDVPAGHRKTAAMSQRREQELAAVALLSRAYAHALRIARACDEAEGLEVERIAPTLEAAFAASSNTLAMTVSELFQIAVFADINPAIFWPRHIDGFAAVFEAGRLMGRLQTGGAAEVDEVVSDLLLASDRADTTYGACDQFIDVVRQAIDGILGWERFAETLRQARREGGRLTIERGTRRLRVVGKPGDERAVSR